MDMVTTAVKMDPDNTEIKNDAERSRKKLLTLIKKQEILLRGKGIQYAITSSVYHTDSVTALHVYYLIFHCICVDCMVTS